MTEPASQKLSIYEAIQKIKMEIKSVGKDRKNSQQQYSFRGIDDLYNELHGPMSTHGVFSSPKVISEHREERPTKSGGVMIYTVLKIRYRFYALDGSFFDAVTVGEASDSGDKSSNKAMSAAHKYALIQVFDVPTNENSDTEYHSPEFKPRMFSSTNKAPLSTKVQHRSENTPSLGELAQGEWDARREAGATGISEDDPGERIIQYGKKYSGKKFKDFPKDQIRQYVEWMRSEGKDHTPSGQKFVTDAEMYLQGGPEGVSSEEEEEDVIPF